VILNKKSTKYPDELKWINQVEHNWGEIILNEAYSINVVAAGY
jgi:hypothetical protein